MTFKFKKGEVVFDKLHKRNVKIISGYKTTKYGHIIYIIGDAIHGREFMETAHENNLVKIRMVKRRVVKKKKLSPMEEMTRRFKV